MDTIYYNFTTNIYTYTIEIFLKYEISVYLYVYTDRKFTIIYQTNNNIVLE